MKVWRDGRAVVGASDAGAHLDFLATFNYSTVLLGGPVRERGLMPIEEAINLLTDVPARLYGLTERGRLRAGLARRHRGHRSRDRGRAGGADAVRPADRRAPPLRRRRTASTT